MAVGSFSLPISSASTEWVRPSDWLPMPTGITSANQTFVGLYAIFPNGNNFAAFLFTTSAGQYQVDWGDGTVTLHNSNTIAQYEYNYATISNSTLTSRGYKQSIITVTAVSGNLLTCDFQRRFVSSPIQNGAYATGFLDCILSMPNASGSGIRSIIFGSNLGTVTVSHAFIERFDIKTIGNCTDLYGLFHNMLYLQSVPIFNTVNVTRASQMFQSCISIQTIPLLNTQNVTNMSSMFNGCRLIQTIPLLNTQNVTDMNNMFQSCVSLQSIPLLNTIKLINMSNMFQSCVSLKSLPLLNTENVTSMLQTFFSCISIEKIPLFNTSKVTNMASMIQSCSSINSIPALATNLVTIFSNFTDSCRSLDRIEMVFNQTVNIGNCQLSRTALVEIFTNLTNRISTTSANINISGNWGASALTAADRLIATSKNWTITG